MATTPLVSSDLPIIRTVDRTTHKTLKGASNDQFQHQSMYIAIAGNIGSGKSLLAELLAQRLGWALSTDVAENPYIDDFYENMRGWSFQLQIYFLGMRLRLLDHALKSADNIIVDRTIYEDAEVFARNLSNQSLIYSRDWKSYYDLYSVIIERFAQPDLLIYLRASAKTLARNIKKRGRAYEAGIDIKYLKNLNELYEDWTFSYNGNLLTIDIDEQNFISSPTAREQVLDQITKIANSR
ncbi:MAG: deoxynucleoside kinase [Mucinivorans sp.]